MKRWQTMTTPSDDILDLLTAYALDALEPEEITHVHALLASNPELRATLAELRVTADTLPYGLPEASPAPELRQRVLDHATGRNGRRPSAATVRPAWGRGWLLGLSGLAATALVAAAIGWGQVVSLRGELTQTRTELAHARDNLALAQTVIATLHGTTGQGAMVRTSAGTTVFTVKLPALPPGRTYQLWRMPKDSQPLSAGLFIIDQQGYSTLALDQQPQSGEQVAVTNEPAGGSDGPTSDPLIIGPVQNT
jgi:anti-sigma-K factor RskA